MITVARVLDAPAGGWRVLVDRLWPRGISRHQALWDEWMPDVAPSPDLRRWYSHRSERFEEFCRRYRMELDDADHALEAARLVAQAAAGPLILVTHTRDLPHSHAAVLQDYLREALGASQHA